MALPVLLLTAWLAPPAAERELALQIAREQERLARAQSLWPGFEPLRIPLAVYTGAATWLFRHPAPPPGFEPEADGVAVFPGRHPAATANSSADLGGVSTATLLADGERGAQGAAVLAAVALHEAFHVDQRRRHPSWQGDEGQMLVYPSADAPLLSLRRQETEALRRALSAPDGALARCWAGRAMAARRARFASLGDALAAYEQGNELNEGLATYVQTRARGGKVATLPAEDFPPDGVRHRAYAVGPALALLLDRLAPGWPRRLEADDRQPLDALLTAAAAEPEACAFTAAEIARFGEVALADIEAMARRRAERRQAFDGTPGWRLVVESAAPLWPQGFDPLNLDHVAGGLLHTRMLKLGNDAGVLQVVDGPGADLSAVTEAAGDHPLFNGVRRATVVGLAQPVVQRNERGVAIQAPGLDVEFAGATLEEDAPARVLTLRLR
jgi:hypothetical protein